jgi:hypothetical protein
MRERPWLARARRRRRDKWTLTASNWIADCPSLRVLSCVQSKDFLPRMARAEDRRSLYPLVPGIFVVPTCIGVLVGLMVTITVAYQGEDPHLSTGVAVGGLLAYLAVNVFALAIGIVYAERFLKLYADDQAMWQIADAIIWVELHPESWSSALRRRQICRALSTCSLAVRTAAYRHVARSDRAVRAMVKPEIEARCKYFEQLKLWVIMPGPFTYTDIIQELCRTLQLYWDKGWLGIPTVPTLEASSAAPPWRKVPFIALAISSMGGLGAVVAYAPHIGPAAVVAAAVIGSVLISALAHLGLSAEGLDFGTRLIRGSHND